jgi:hypothetical protein
MAYKDVELILTRQLASYLVSPIFLVGPDGTLLYYNEPAEAILGHRFEETGEVSMETWSTMYTPTDEKGNDLSPGDLPLVIAITHRKPAHKGFWIMGRDNVRRHIEVTAFPLLVQGDHMIGALSIFWEDRE